MLSNQKMSHFKWQYRAGAGAGAGARTGTGAKIKEKVEPEPKINNFGSATMHFTILSLNLEDAKISVAEPEPIGAGTFWSEPV